MTVSHIHRLPPDMVNKIAAGEVVERPASVVKELMENAVDAQASRIEITLNDGGRKLIRVVDDGLGMSPEDFELVFESHATSKIDGVDDLFEIDTLGFRGEALASVASVSRCRIMSRQRGSATGAGVEAVGGRLGEVKACGAPEGTIVEVRDLFYNTPARRKFLRTAPTELRHATEAVTRIALPHSAMAFTLLHNDRPILRLHPASSPRERAATIFGDAFCERLLSVYSQTAALVVTGLVTPPGEGLRSSRQYVFLNGRYVRDRAIHRAIAEAYRSRLMKGRYPGVVLYLQMDPARVDVNVHPTKVEVRFRDPAAVFAQVLSAIEMALQSAGPLAGRSDAARPTSTRTESADKVRLAMADFFERSGRQPQNELHRPGPGGRSVTQQPSDRATGSAAQPSVVRTTSGVESEEGALREHPASETTPAIADPAEIPSVTGIGRPRTFCQVHDSYIVEEVADGLLLIDQHALHERIIYDDLRRRSGRAPIPRQRLLVPEIVDLTPDDLLHIEEMGDDLRRLGIEVAPFGERTVAVHAVPHVGGEVNPRDLLLDLLRTAGEAVEDRPGDREERLMRVIACKAAVKAGDRLSRAQIEALLDQRSRIGPEPTCPHGRPTTLHFSLDDLEKQFRRK